MDITQSDAESMSHPGQQSAYYPPLTQDHLANPVHRHIRTIKLHRGPTVANSPNVGSLPSGSGSAPASPVARLMPRTLTFNIASSPHSSGATRCPCLQHPCTDLEARLYTQISREGLACLLRGPALLIINVIWMDLQNRPFPI